MDRTERALLAAVALLDWIGMDPYERDASKGEMDEIRTVAEDVKGEYPMTGLNNDQLAHWIRTGEH